MKKCVKECMVKNKGCPVKECRFWIDFGGDFNCSNVSVEKHGDMTLAQIAERMDLSIVRIKQIQDKALQKLRKKRHLKAF